MRHTHADLIHAWAEGAEIQTRGASGIPWVNCHSAPEWHASHEYRIKPEKKPDVVKYYRVSDAGYYMNETACDGCGHDHLRITFSRETGELIKAEVLK